MQLSNKVYNVLKPIALVWLPAIGTLYFALAGIWNLPDAQQVIGSITALDTFLGVGLHLSSVSYAPAADGNLVVDTSDPTKDSYSLELTTPLATLANKDSVTLQVLPKA